jgi:hypothetical protein
MFNQSSILRVAEAPTYLVLPLWFDGAALSKSERLAFCGKVFIDNPVQFSGLNLLALRHFGDE